MAKVSEKSKTIVCRNEKFGVSFNATITAKVYEGGSGSFGISAFGAGCDLRPKDGMTTLFFAEYNFGDWGKNLSAAFNAQVKKGSAQVAISPDNAAEIRAFMAEHDADIAKEVAENIERLAARPKRYVAYDHLNWGDYSIEKDQEIVELRQEPSGAWVRGAWKFDAITSTTERKAMWENILTRPVSDVGECYRDITLEEAREWSAWATEEGKRMEAERIESEKRKADAHAAEIERIKSAQSETEENELFVFSARETYASAGARMIHSIGAKVGDQIEIYTTGYATDMKRAGKPHTTTFDAKEELKAIGFRFDGESKNWAAPFSPEKWEATLPILKKYDTKLWPSDLGMNTCWECGGHFTRAHARANGGNWNEDYCGC